MHRHIDAANSFATTRPLSCAMTSSCSNYAQPYNSAVERVTEFSENVTEKLLAT